MHWFRQDRILGHADGVAVSVHFLTLSSHKVVVVAGEPAKGTVVVCSLKERGIAREGWLLPRREDWRVDQEESDGMNKNVYCSCTCFLARCLWRASMGTPWFFARCFWRACMGTPCSVRAHSSLRAPSCEEASLMIHGVRDCPNGVTLPQPRKSNPCESQEGLTAFIRVTLPQRRKSNPSHPAEWSGITRVTCARPIVMIFLHDESTTHTDGAFINA